MKTTIKGQIMEIGPTQQISEKFQKRNVVIKTNDAEYPQIYGCELVQDKCALADKFAPGEQVIAECDIRGREWTNPQGIKKYFISLNIWLLKLDQETGVDIPPADGGIEKNFQEDAINEITKDLDDGLPF